MGHRNSMLYGYGVFTTIAINHSAPFLWSKHWIRLQANSLRIGLSLDKFPAETVSRELKVEIERAGMFNGRARVTFSDESPSRIWSTDEGEKRTSLSIIVAERRPITEDFKVTISPHRTNTTSPLVGIKSCNYLEHLLAYEQATKRGFHEAIRLNERGKVASACMANVFWETKGKLFTPSPKTGCLPGTTREYLLENIECEVVEAGIEAVEKADRIFLTSAGIGVVCVEELNGRILDTSDHPLKRLLPY
jgi:branched-subunit amino acid aminotransferase/4-amino-4-deoxychorismate lyase